MSSQRIAIAAVLWWMVVTGLRQAVCDTHLPKDIQDGVSANVAALDPIDVTWDQRRVPVGGIQATLTRLRFGTRAKSNPGSFFETKRFHVRVSDVRLYFSRQTVTRSWIDRSAEVFEVAFDGDVVHTGSVNRTDDRRKPIPPVLIRKHPNQFESPSNLGGTWISLELLEWWGVQVPENHEEFASRKLRSLLLALMPADGRVHLVESRSLGSKPYVYVEILGANPEWESAVSADPTSLQDHLLRSRTSQEQIEAQVQEIEAAKELPAQRMFCFYLDPEMNYAVRRQERRNPDGTLLLRADNTSFRRLPGHDVWLPRKCNVDYFSYPSMLGEVSTTPVLRAEFQVRSIEIMDHPKERFQLQYDLPGTMITDHTTGPGPVTYVIPADNAALESVVKEARDQASQHGQGSLRQRIARFWTSTTGRVALIVGNAAIIVSLLVILYRRGR